MLKLQMYDETTNYPIFALTIGKMDLRNLPLFYILGRPRSGTTLLQLILDSHPDVLIPLEAPVYIELRYRYKNTTHWTPKILERFLKDLYNVTFFKDMPLDHEELKKEILSMEGNHSIYDLMSVPYKHYKGITENDEIKIIGDKNPVYSIIADNIFREMPQAKFIHIYRDYRDNIESLMRMNFEAGIPALLAYRWKFTYRLMDQLIEKEPERIYRIKYESLCAEPEKYTREICNFLEIDFQEKMLDFHSFYSKNEKELKEETAKIHKNLRNPINSSRIGLWKTRLSDRQVKICDMVVGSLAEEAGYERKFKKYSFGLRISQCPILIYGRLIFFAMRNIEYVPGFLRNFMAWGIAQFIRIYNYLSGRSKLKNESR